jgi:hypothetical protein
MIMMMQDSNNNNNNNKKGISFGRKNNTQYSVICSRKCNYTEIRADLGDYKLSVLYGKKT